MFGPMPSWSCVAGAFGEDEVRAFVAKWRGGGSPRHSQKAETPRGQTQAMSFKKYPTWPTSSSQDMPSHGPFSCEFIERLLCRWRQHSNIKPARD